MLLCIVRAAVTLMSLVRKVEPNMNSVCTTQMLLLRQTGSPAWMRTHV